LALRSHPAGKSEVKTLQFSAPAFSMPYSTEGRFKAANVLCGSSGQQHKAVFLFSFETDLAGG
jgi:hypothetical protein